MKNNAQWECVSFLLYFRSIDKGCFSPLVRQDTVSDYIMKTEICLNRCISKLVDITDN